MKNYEKLTNFSGRLVFRELFFGTANLTYLFLTFVSLNVFFPLSNFITYSDTFLFMFTQRKILQNFFSSSEQKLTSNEQRAKSFTSQKSR